MGSFYSFRNFPCIQTRYILSWRLRLTRRRRSTPSCSILNSGCGSFDAAIVAKCVAEFARPDGPGSGPDCAFMQGSSTGDPEVVKGVDTALSQFAVGDIRSGEGNGGVSVGGFCDRPPSSSLSFASSTYSMIGGWDCFCVGTAAEPVNNDANSSSWVRVNRAIQCGFAHVSTANEFHVTCGRNILSPSSKKYTRVLSPLM